MIKPATIAVINPFSGDTPEATAKAMANGRATIPTMIPAKTSLGMDFLSKLFRRILNSFGLKTGSMNILFFEGAKV
jgi:hypothetical protein